jgi:arylamine N-acetyltransferase
MLDVGFGGDGATKPLPLIPDAPTRNLGTQEVRLVYGPLENFSDQSQHHWIYQYRNSRAQNWNSLYAFPGIEFLQRDLEVMNHYTSTSVGDTNFQTRRVLGIRFLRGEVDAEGEAEIVGKVMLVDGDVKRNMGGKTSVITTCRTEEERVRALKEYFNITLTEEEIHGVKGRNVELLGR